MSRALPIAVLLLAACDTVHAPSAAGDEAPKPVVQATHLTWGASSFLGGDPTQALTPLVSLLSRRLGVPVSLRVAEPYAELPALVLSGEVDVAQLAPEPYLRVRATDPAVRALAAPVVAGSPTYLGHLYVRDDSRFHTLEDLAGARIGFVTPQSTSGYLFARDLLRRRGVDPDTLFSSQRFFHSHPAVLLAVQEGDVDVGAAVDVTSDWGAGDADRPAGLRVIAKTARIPNDCVVTRSGLDEGSARAIEAVLLGLRAERAEDGVVLAALKLNGYLPADERRYDTLRDVLAREANALPATPGTDAPVGGPGTPTRTGTPGDGEEAP